MKQTAIQLLLFGLLSGGLLFATSTTSYAANAVIPTNTDSIAAAFLARKLTITVRDATMLLAHLKNSLSEIERVMGGLATETDPVRLQGLEARLKEIMRPEVKITIRNLGDKNNRTLDRDAWIGAVKHTRAQSRSVSFSFSSIWALQNAFVELDEAGNRYFVFEAAIVQRYDKERLNGTHYRDLTLKIMALAMPSGRDAHGNFLSVELGAVLVNTVPLPAGNADVMQKRLPAIRVETPIIE